MKANCKDSLDLEHLDQELDYRFQTLCLQRRVNGNLVKSGNEINKIQKEAVCTPKTKPPDPVTCKEIVTETINDDDDDDGDEDDSCLSEFLTRTTELKIKTLKTKCENLEKALTSARKKINQMTTEVEETKKRSKDSTKELASLNKMLLSKENILKKKEKEKKETLEENSRKSQLCRDLNKKIQALERESKQDTKRMSSLQNQVQNMKIQLVQVNKKLVEEQCRSKEVTENMQNKLENREERCQSLLRNVSTLSAMVKKQEQLISVLQQQKLNIASARMTKQLEEEFNSLLEPFLRSSDLDKL